ncbi:MAG: glycosyltransferase family 4 protein [Desulfomonile tiedjei]|uniref:Glycosyltransferase family 4 protein n=1 Tax=Desulfomonile tiedjei TaxID=2358 RepID=A0A9D6Z2P6_9BACT|nr:glycosyltransferase family 4 protein [Desulfomonile tiedjei]
MLRPRILLLTTCYPSCEGDPSGVFIERLAIEFRKKGHHVGVVCPSDGSFFGRRVVNGIDTVRFGYFRPRSFLRLTKGLGGIPENLSQSWLARIQLFPMMFFFLLHTLFEVRRFDIVYANWLGAGIIGAITNMLTGKPMVVSFRGDDGYLARDRVLWRALTLWVSSRAGVVAPVSEELRNVLAAVGIAPAKLRVPRFGVDAELFRPPTSRPNRSDSIQAVFVGALIQKKGLQDLIRALADPSFKHVKLVVLGDGVMRDRLVEECNELGLSDQVEWMGQRPQRDVADIMANSDVLILPSYTEGKPNVVKEAMASGLPVVATRVGGIPELVDDGKTGLLFTPGDVAQLRHCLKQLIDDKDLRSRMSRAALESLRCKALSWEATVEDFEGIFECVLEAARATLRGSRSCRRSM